jgi:transposase-like protein
MPQARRELKLYTVKRRDQREALTSPLRLEIIEHLVYGPATVAEIARRMGRRPDSLYYHIRLLARVGLLVPAGTRKRGKRDETVYDIVAKGIVLPVHRRDQAVIDTTMKTIGAAFRRAEREMRNTLERGTPCMSGDERNFWAAHQHIRIRPTALKKINQLLARAQDIIAREHEKPPADAESALICSYTVALFPVCGRGGDGSTQVAK